MGFIVKFQEDQKDRWDIFFKYLEDIYQNGDFFVMPIENGGYCIAANPFHKAVYQKLLLLLGPQVYENLIMISNKKKHLEKFAEFPDMAQKFAQEYWPGNLILSLKPKKGPITLKKNSFPQDILDNFPIVQLFLANHHFVNVAIFDWLEKMNHPPLLLGFYPITEPGLDVHDPQEMLQSFGAQMTKIAFDAGKVQEGPSSTLEPLTTIRITDKTTAEVIQIGIISADMLKIFFKQIEEAE